MKLNFTKHLSNNRSKRVNRIKADIFWFLVLTASIVGLLWVMLRQIK